MQREPGAWGITGPPCHWGDLNIKTMFSRLGFGREADELALKKLIDANSNQ
jgi:hypothetical protein